MINRCLFAVFVLMTLSLTGQNLVPNCDFDKVNSCPNNTGQLDRARDWYTPGEGTSDLCHYCGGGSVGTPFNMWGYEDPYSGQGYANIICYHPMQGNDYREYVQVKLVCPLEAGETYNVAFQVSVSDNSRYAIDAIGLLFTDDPIMQNGTNVIDPDSPGHIYNPPGTVITKKTGWLRISGQYTAAGGEEYITIGSFIPEYEMTIVPFDGSTSLYTSFYVDGVSVTPVNPMILLGNDTTLCYGESYFISAPSLCSGTFAWEDGSTSPDRWLTGPGKYTLTVNIGCSVLTDDFVLSWQPEPQLNMPPDTVICHGGSIWMDPGDFFTYLWQDGSTGQGYMANEAGTYWVEITDDLDCSYRDTVEIGWLEVPDVELGGDMVLCYGDSLRLDAQNENTYTTYLWQDNSSQQFFTVKEEGIYNVVVSNPCGSDLDNIMVSYKDCNPVVTVPNAFTPNGDGRNDTFRASGVNITNYRLQVFNRWGELIFSSFDPGLGWDGRKNGVDCASEVYVWSIYYESNALEETVSETLSGTVMLIR